MTGASERETSAAAVLSDPFWSVVHRRHPDVDIVIRPPEAAPASWEWPADPEPLDAALHEQRCRDIARSLWEDCGLPAPASTEQRWTSGSPTHSVRREVTVRGAVDAPRGIAALLALGRRLAEADWAVAEPVDGFPRVLASRAAAGNDWEVVMVQPDATTLTLRLRSAALPVPAAQARDLVAAAHATDSSGTGGAR